MKNLIIIGAGNFGREVFFIASQSPECGVEWKIKGFLDERKDVLKPFNYEVGILGSPEDYVPKSEDVFVCAYGYPPIKKKNAKYILEKGGRFINLIHPTAIVAKNVKMGSGNILYPYSVVSSDSIIGDHVAILFHAVVGHNCTINSWSQISPGANLNGWVKLDEEVLVGSNSTMLPHSFAGKSATIGAGSVVLKEVKAGQTVFGSPAKPFGFPKLKNSN